LERFTCLPLPHLWRYWLLPYILWLVGSTGTGGSTGGRPPVYRRHIGRVGTHARSSPSGVIYVGKGLRYLTRATITITPRQSIYKYPSHRQIYTNILFCTIPPMHPKFHYRQNFQKSVKEKEEIFKRNLAPARYIRIFMS
jgi:hypothetical protein